MEDSGWTCHEMWSAMFTAVSIMDLDAYPHTHPVDLRSILHDIHAELGKLPTSDTRILRDEEQMPSMEVLQIMWWIMFPVLFTKAYTRAVFATSNGYVGRAPDSMQEGDLVVVLYGQKTPFIV